MRKKISFRSSSLILWISLFIACQSSAQAPDTAKPRQRNAYGLWLLPNTKDHLYGIGIGPLGSEVFCKPTNIKHSYGINIQLLGEGFFVPLNPAFRYKYGLGSDTCWLVRERDSGQYRAKHYGLILSTFGTMTDVSNGLVIGGISSLGYRLNGIAIHVFGCKYVYMNGISIAMNNQAYDVKGIQIGLLNRTNKLKGFQFGLWNVNSKRKLPLINWCFSD